MTQNILDSGIENGFLPEGQDAALKPAVTWQDQDDLLRTLWHENVSPEGIAEKLGRSVAAIMTRAARLSLPRRSAPGRKRGYKRSDMPQREKTATIIVRTKVPRSVAKSIKKEEEESPEVMQRICLMCLNKFKSLGRHNRICSSCKGSAEYTTGSSTPDFISDSKSK